jgi:hypothetical protein
MKTASVTFEGHDLVLIVFADGEGALAFPHQVNEEGHIKLECQLEPGFAHIDSDGQIWRERGVIAFAQDHPDLAPFWKGGMSPAGDQR